jgi:predicted DNA-binding protein (UPF0251 family)
LSVREISLRLGVTEKTVENLLRLAQAQVMKALFAEGGVDSVQADEKKRDDRRSQQRHRSERNRS